MTKIFQTFLKALVRARIILNVVANIMVTNTLKPYNNFFCLLKKLSFQTQNNDMWAYHLVIPFVNVNIKMKTVTNNAI